MNTYTISSLAHHSDDTAQASRPARLRNRGLADTIGNAWKVGRCPNDCEVTAEKAEKAGHYLLAARCWVIGSAVSMGANRADRYEAAANRCLAKLAPAMAEPA